MKKFLFGILLAVGAVGAASAVCPVCTVAVGAGLESARLLGVDDVITGIWAGGLTLSVFFWTAGWLKKHNIKKHFMADNSALYFILCVDGWCIFNAGHKLWRTKNVWY